MVHLGGYSAAPGSLRRRGREGSGIPRVAARGSAGEGDCGCQFQRRRWQDIDRSTSGDVGALDGYKVLVIDLDSQGSMTSILGGTVADEWETVFPLMARDYALNLQAENKVREAAGLPLFPFDETLTEALGVSPRNLVQKTHWPNIDLIGAQLNLYWAEFQVPVWRMQLKSWALWDSLSNALSEGGLLDDYDMIFLDTPPPALGYLTINALAAADILLVPLGASFLEFDSTGRFFDMIYSTFSSIEEGENRIRARMACRRCGLNGMRCGP